MATARLRIWCNQVLPDEARRLLGAGVGGHELVFARRTTESNLIIGSPDQTARESDIAFGQPDPSDIVHSTRLKWIHLNSAGYTKYDRDDLREALHARGGMMTTSSSVYSDPSAQHVLAMMLTASRRLGQSLMSQQNRTWDYRALRPAVRVLSGESALIVGFGAIGRRLVELLRPFEMKIRALRRTIRGDEPIETRTLDQIDNLLVEFDHVVDLLPAGSNTKHFFNADRFARMKPGAYFYNVGRGDTVDQDALSGALRSGQLGAVYLDVTTPEPLPPEHSLWTTPNCFITPHIAGGHQGEHRRLVEHFLTNLERFERGRALEDRIA